MKNTAYIYKVVVGIGTDRNNNSIPEIVSATALKALKVEAARRFGGYSVTIADGGWVDGSGRLIEERSAKFEIVSNGGFDQPIREFAGRAAELLNQSCVLVTKVEGSHEFVQHA